MCMWKFHVLGLLFKHGVYLSPPHQTNCSLTMKKCENLKINKIFYQWPFYCYYIYWQLSIFFKWAFCLVQLHTSYISWIEPDFTFKYMTSTRKITAYNVPKKSAPQILTTYHFASFWLSDRNELRWKKKGGGGGLLLLSL